MCIFNYNAPVYKIWNKSIKKCVLHSCAHKSQDSKQNMTFYPIKDGPLGVASPKTIRVYIWLWWTSIRNLKEIHQEMWPPERTQDSNQNMTFDPIKDGPLGAASPTRPNAKRGLACCPRDSYKQLAGNGFKFTDPCSLTMGSSKMYVNTLWVTFNHLYKR